MVHEAASFAMLIHELVNAHHAGNLRAMAQRTGVPYTTLVRWEHGDMESPRLVRVVQFCNAYKLELADVVELLGRDAVTRAKGGRPAIPLLEKKRGPSPDPTSKRSMKRFGRVVGAAIVACGLWWSPAGATPATAPALSAAIGAADDFAGLRLIGERIRRAWWRARRRALWRRRQSDPWGMSACWTTSVAVAA